MCHATPGCWVLAFQMSKDYERFSKFLPSVKGGVFLEFLPLPRLSKL